ncbi:hypothetical protein T05_8700 [Trichinella murrelli]|uniref:BAR domain-containing protein n=3 Tax=Trichinella TaxID=6333 RepID=A0A0V0U885_9BILA|nr:hypothetical protein T05_8700 [Trichinella murrelli]
MEAKQLLLEKTKLTEEFDEINISVTKLLTDMGNASEIKSIADKCLKATKNEFSKQVETFTIYENSTLSLHESVKALMAECEQLNEDLKTKENASENMKQKIEEAQKSIAEIDNELHQYIKLRQKRKYDSDGVPENSETELEKLKYDQKCVLFAVSIMSLKLVETCFNNQFTQFRRVVSFFCVHFDLIIQFSRKLRKYRPIKMARNWIKQKIEGPQGDEKFSDQYSKLILFAENLKEMIELVKCVVQNSKKHRKNPHMLPSLTDDEIFKLSKSLKQLSSTMKQDGAKNSIDKAHEMFAELSEQNLNYLKQVSIKAIVKMESYSEDRMPLIKDVKTKVDMLFCSYNRENDKYKALKLKFEQATEGSKLVKGDIKIKEAERRLKQVKEAYHKELKKSYEMLDNFSNYENEVMEALRMLIKYRLEFHENALKIFKQQ